MLSIFQLKQQLRHCPIPAKVTMSVDETANTVTLTSDKDTNAVLVQASYRTDNTLDSVKKVVNLELKLTRLN